MLLFLPSILELDAQPSDNPLLYPHSLITLKLPLPPLQLLLLLPLSLFPSYPLPMLLFLLLILNPDLYHVL